MQRLGFEHFSIFPRPQSAWILQNSTLIDAAEQVEFKNVLFDATAIIVQMSQTIEHVFPLAQPLVLYFGTDLWPQLISNFDGNLPIACSGHKCSHDTTFVQIRANFHNLSNPPPMVPHTEP